jgi:fructuronate reductase
VTEGFTQFVIENNFPAGRPDFKVAGAELVKDVEPYERMKLRMLNGSHSTLAYLGYLAGHEYVADVVTDPAFKALVETMMNEEIIPTLPMERKDLEVYRDRLLRRFANPALKHRTWQIAMDGSQKLPQRLLNTIRARLRGDHKLDRLALGVAAWMRYVTGIDEKDQPIDVKDPLAGKLRAIADGAARDPQKLVIGLLGVTEVFGPDLRDDATFRAVLVDHVQSLFMKGAAATVREMASAGTAAAFLKDE